MDTKRKIIANSLEYWLLHPYDTLNDKDLPYCTKIMGLLQNLQTDRFYGEDYDKTLSELELTYQNNKMHYKYVERRQVEKAMSNMKSSVINRIITKQVMPIATKVVETVVPVVKDTINNTVLPATDKTLRFLTKVFVKPKIEVVEVKKNDN